MTDARDELLALTRALAHAARRRSGLGIRRAGAGEVPAQGLAAEGSPGVSQAGTAPPTGLDPTEPGTGVAIASDAPPAGRTTGGAPRLAPANPAPRSPETAGPAPAAPRPAGAADERVRVESPAVGRAQGTGAVRSSPGAPGPAVTQNETPPAPGQPPAVPPPPRGDAPLPAEEVERRAAAVREAAAACPDLASLARAVAGCQACGLCHTRKNTVFADGDGSAGVLFVGEAPGAREDEQGVPFVGDAGRLLTDIVTKGMGLERQRVMIANVLKCRPPGNRDPSPEEKRICTPWLDRQVALAGLRVLVPLGRHAAQHLLEAPGASMGSLRGKVHRRGERVLVPTFHPAYLLRNPADKRTCWQDIQLAMAEMGLSVPERRPGPPQDGDPGTAGSPPASR